MDLGAAFANFFRDCKKISTIPAIAGAVLDCGFHELRRQLRYEPAMRGGRIVVADRLFPSSKTCSAGGCVNPDVMLGVDVWTCIECGVVHERDPSGAINLEKLGLAEVGSSRRDIAPLPACLRIPAGAAEPRTLMRRSCAHT
jgi:putative transposase